ncbi:porin family protein [Flavobacterium sp. LS1R49]|uniref:Porin family protein n=1 Tax=Flavobacterium shii TaxID=2987687 RepID=A0A9X2ZCL6_9FLAO|nr:porin family protein [Flavobacterium shii]MCV9927262.1 porin family protein [Flavobacterium shii]
MKKMLVVIALAVVSFANAQKGTVLVGGSVGYSSHNVSNRGNDSKESVFNFSPRVGYQFNDNWTVGGEFTVATAKEEFGNNENKINNFALGAFLRYTLPLNQTFSVFADLGAGFQNQKDEVYNGFVTTTAKADGMYVGITPAIFINVKKGFGLNFNIGGLGYSALSYEHNGPDVNDFSFSFGKAFNIGISKNF